MHWGGPLRFPQGCRFDPCTFSETKPPTDGTKLDVNIGGNPGFGFGGFDFSGQSYNPGSVWSFL